MPRFKQQITADRGAILNGGYGGEFLLKNWPYITPTPLNLSGKSVVWDDTNRLWFSFGTDGSTTFIFTSSNGIDWVTLPTNIPNFAVDVMSATKVPNQNMIFMGGDPPGNSPSKVYYSTNGGGTWNVPTGGVGGVDAEAVRATGYGPNFGYLAMGTLSGHIYHSAVGSSGWSLVFTAGGSPSVMFKGVVTANNLGTPIALACYNGSTTYYSSLNGTTWVSRTFPVTPSSVTYSSTLKKWFMASGGGALYVSSSGISAWTAVSTGASVTTVRSFGALLLGVGQTDSTNFATSGVMYSPDQGVTWYPIMSTNSIGVSLAVAQQHTFSFGIGANEPIIEPHQALYVTGAPTATYYASLKGQ
jgi:hypothetical protein